MINIPETRSGEISCPQHRQRVRSLSLSLRTAGAWLGGRQGRGCAAPATAWEHLLMSQERSYVMTSPPHALPLPPSHPPAESLGSIVTAETEAYISAGRAAGWENS